MIKISKVENTEKKWLVALIIEFGIVAVLILLLVFNHAYKSKKADNMMSKGNTETTAAIDGAQALADADSALSSSYANLIVGDYTAENGHRYSFVQGGAFSGYVNDENAETSGTYTVVTNGSKSIVTVKCDSAEKSYDFKFNADGAIELTDNETGEVIVLE